MADPTQAADTAALSQLLHARSIGDILDATIRLYRRHFLLYFGIVIIVQGVVFVVSQAFQIPFYFLNRRLGAASETGITSLEDLMGFLPLAATTAAGFVLLLAVSLVAYQFSTGGLLIAVSETFLGRAITISRAYREVLARFWSLLGAGLLSSLLGLAVMLAGGGVFAVCLVGGQLFNDRVIMVVAVLAGLFALLAAVIGSIYVFLSLLLAPQAVMLEDARAVEALRRSWELMWSRSERGMFRNNVFRAGVILTLVLILNAVVAMLVQVPIVMLAVVLAVQSDAAPFATGTVPLWLQVPMQLLQTVAGAVVMPIGLVALILFYYDIRIRFEGFDLQVLSSALDPR